nr:uncharacterized protein LOC129046206 [Mirounga angustirostris]
MHSPVHSSVYSSVIYSSANPPTHCPSAQSSIHPSTHLSIHPPTHPTTHPFTYPIHPSTHPSIHPSTHPASHPASHPHPFTHPSIHPFIHLSTHPKTRPFTYPSIRPSIHRSIHFLSTHLFICHPSINPSIYSFIYIHLSVHSSICPSTHPDVLEHLLCSGYYPRALLTNKTFPSSTVGYRSTQNRVCHHLIFASWLTPALHASALIVDRGVCLAFWAGGGGFVLIQVGQSRLEVIFWAGFLELSTTLSPRKNSGAKGLMVCCPCQPALDVPFPIKYMSVPPGWKSVDEPVSRVGLGRVLHSPLNLTAPAVCWGG